MTWVLAALQLALSATLILAATAKLLRSDEFVAALRLSHLPDPTVRPLAVAVPLLEAALAVALVLAPADLLPVVFGATGALLVAFTLWMGWVRLRRLHVKCGCFGAGGEEVGPGTIGRNLVLLVGTGAGLVLSTVDTSPLPPPSLAMAVVVSSLGLVVALLAALRLVWPHLIVTFARMEADGAGAADGE